MKKIPFFLLAAVFSCLYLNGMAQNTSTSSWSKKEVRHWFKHGDWQKDLAIKPHSSVNEKEFAIQYQKHKQRWDKAFDFLNRTDLSTLDTGTYPIVARKDSSGGKEVFASISKYVPKDFDKSQWESHKKYADIQCMIQGEEKIGMTSISGLTVTVPFAPGKDIAHYKGPGKYYRAKPGTFFIFFPGEAHRPNIKPKPGDTAVVKKIVIKVQVD